MSKYADWLDACYRMAIFHQLRDFRPPPDPNPFPYFTLRRKP